MNRKQLNWSLLSGFGVGGALISLAAFHSTSTPWIFLNLIGFGIVFGGLVSASLIMYPFEQIKDLTSALVGCIYFERREALGTVREILQLSTRLTRENAMVGSLHNDASEALRAGLQMVSSGVRTEEIKRRLELVANYNYERHLKHSVTLLTLAKLGPGFGLLGTILGLVVLLQDMGSSGNFDNVGPALAISLLATLYGVIFANLVLQPLAEYLRISAEANFKFDQVVMEGVVGLRDRKHPLQLRDSLRGFLSAKESLQLDISETTERKPQQAA